MVIEEATAEGDVLSLSDLELILGCEGHPDMFDEQGNVITVMKDEEE